MSLSSFKIALNNSLKLPELHALSDQNMRFRNRKCSTWVCDGDDAISSSKFMMKQYLQKNKNYLDYHLSRMRIIYENDLGIVTDRRLQKWVFSRTRRSQSDNQHLLLLHFVISFEMILTTKKNYILLNLCKSEVLQTGETTEGLWRSNPKTESWCQRADHASKEANAFRE